MDTSAKSIKGVLWVMYLVIVLMAIQTVWDFYNPIGSSRQKTWAELEAYHDTSPDVQDFVMLNTIFKEEIGSGQVPPYTIQEVAHAGVAHHYYLYAVSISTNYYAEFRAGILRLYAREGYAPKQFDTYQKSPASNDIPRWWDPPETECLAWQFSDGYCSIIYDNDKQLLYVDIMAP